MDHFFVRHFLAFNIKEFLYASVKKGIHVKMLEVCEIDAKFQKSFDSMRNKKFI